MLDMLSTFAVRVTNEPGESFPVVLEQMAKPVGRA